MGFYTTDVTSNKFSYHLRSGLKPNTNYFVCAFAIDTIVHYGIPVLFHTHTLAPQPTASTGAINQLSANTASFYKHTYSGCTATTQGLVFSTSNPVPSIETHPGGDVVLLNPGSTESHISTKNATRNLNKTASQTNNSRTNEAAQYRQTNSSTNKTALFSCNLTGLSANTTYYVRAFIRNANDSIIYAKNVMKFTTTTENTPTSACGESLTITHTTENGVTPSSITSDVTITYKTLIIPAEVTGTEKCFIAQNIGATRAGNNIFDTSTDVNGWYWKFNRKQAYSPTDRYWQTNPREEIWENKNWEKENDPCTMELGEGWRVPTVEEYTSIATYCKERNMDAVALFDKTGLLFTESGYLNISTTDNKVISVYQNQIGGYWTSQSKSYDSASIFKIVTNTSNTNTPPTISKGGKNYLLKPIRCIKDTD